MFFEDCTDCVRQRKSYQELLKHISKTILKSMENQCRIRAPNNSTKNKTNDQK